MNDLEVKKDTNSVVEFSKIASKRWSFDMHSRNRIGLISGTTMDTSSKPIGYVERSFPQTMTRDHDDQLMSKRSWDIALGPIRQVPMNLFIMWMTGNSISIFPIMMVIMMLMRPIQALFSLQTSKFTDLVYYISDSYNTCINCCTS